ncbi:hypothetical protein CC2G_004875 [Coprinopsis cinerea AmutBmut pab1-1]|nr:hypothetical protein CC2G_004875 [Coprinopsis cinerea AmutBmut pab1-1]
MLDISVPPNYPSKPLKHWSPSPAHLTFEIEVYTATPPRSASRTRRSKFRKCHFSRSAQSLVGTQTLW